MSNGPRFDPFFDGSQLTQLQSGAELPDGTFSVSVAGRPELRLDVDGSAPRPLLLGKSSSSDLVLEDAAVSRRHCSLELVGARLRVTDLGSSNGTTVNGIAIREVLLKGGEALVVGATTLEVTRHPHGKNPIVPDATGFGRLLGESRVMRRLYPLLKKLAATDVPVLIEGETGTGKEVVAEALHEQGPRASEPFVVFDCTAVPASLVESELFGHERGSFTGASATRKGVFEQAHGGTLFIDEIGDLDLALQPKLLRAIERSEVRRVGGDRWIGVDVRILSATRRDLDREVQAGRFRDDLFHRLAVTRVELPPLRARLDDVPLLVSRFRRQGSGAGDVPAELLTRWKDWNWPGNVRELRNAVARFDAIGAADLEPADPSREADALPVDLIAEVIAKNLPLYSARAKVVEAFERRYLAAVLAAHGGVVTKAAEASGIARRHFQRMRAKGR